MKTLDFDIRGVRAVVFDLDGTLYVDDRLGEEVHQSACRYVAEIKGISPRQAQDALLEARSCSSDSGGTLSRAVEALGGTLQELHHRFSEDIHPEELLAPDPRVQRLLERLGERYELHVYTNNNRSLSTRIMAQLGIGGYFKKIFTIEDSWRPKPDREVLTGILETIGRRPQETLFVGDRYRVDLELPQSLGCAILETRTVEELLTLGQLLD
ncbi:haloacid dehalogenase [Geomonas silvestris]|uniref:phosphoglycolate phosphatase n=1 Tax=Geomonas silvestris TaxID=2740184 RepID=A0A6V8MEM1_9BACT|nr:HAD family hydrolase [Geomonas silvestris]GFO58273.1 haloacid dehalogenase [Geomonas silvestris]